LLCIAIGTLGKGFDEVMPDNDNEFLVKTIENVEDVSTYSMKLEYKQIITTLIVLFFDQVQNRCRTFCHHFPEPRLGPNTPPPYITQYK
jgi:hypothetical protein